MYTPFAFIKTSTQSIYQIYFSRPAPDNRACFIAPDTSLILYTDDIAFRPNSMIYTNSSFTTPFNGDGQYYSIYNLSSNPYNIYVQVDKFGVIQTNGSCI
jgi:hypothetical protein